MADFTPPERPQGLLQETIGSVPVYWGRGQDFALNIDASHSPEVGSVGYGFGSGQLLVLARVTDQAREYLARSVTDGTSFVIDQFAVGVGGYDPSSPLTAIDVDPKAETLISEVYRNQISLVEDPTPDGTAKSFLCRVGKDDVKAGIGEIGLFATILHSPFILEVGQTFLFAAVHQPLQGKTNNHVLSLRLVLVL